jgi:hypothetical protein
MRLLLILLTLAVVGCGQKPFPASRLSLPAGGFSFVTPDGWFRSKVAGIDFLVVCGPQDYGMQPNIFIEGIIPSTNPVEAVTTLVSRYKANYRSYGVSTQEVFTTASGLTGMKITAGRKNNDAVPMSLFHYTVLARDHVFLATCSCSQPVAGRYEPVFDAAMKSVEAEPVTQPAKR